MSHIATPHRDTSAEPPASTRRGPAPKPLSVRFAGLYRVEANGCWIWTGYRNHDGYGIWTIRPGLTVRAHRWSYEQKHGPIPQGLELDHFKCDTSSCVNPDHVRPVTHRENVLRSDKTVAAVNLSKTHCKRGHLLPVAGKEYRHCKVCVREAARAKYVPKPRPRREAPPPPRRVDPKVAEADAMVFGVIPERLKPLAAALGAVVGPSPTLRIPEPPRKSIRRDTKLGRGLAALCASREAA